MRTTKFRGKTKGNEWVYGYYVYTYPNEHRIFGKDRTSIEVIPETIGQYTGLKDCNDSEIYEGDIIHIKTESVNKDFGIVKWNTNGYFFVDDTFSNKVKDANPIGNFFESIRMSRNDIEITVNSNIHDRPESMKDGKVMRTKDVESICLALGWNYSEQTKKYTKTLPDGFCAVLYRVSDIRFFLEIVNRQGLPAREEYVRNYKQVEQILEDFK